MINELEVEYKLEVIGEDPGAIWQQIRGLNQLGEFALGPVETRIIHDLYFDTPDEALRRRCVLRLRYQDGTLRLGFKANLRRVGGRASRREVEVEPTPAGWERMRQEVAAIGVILPAITPAGPPATWPIQAGLVLQQDRTTRRIARPVLREGEVVAEMALDATTYHLRRGDITAYEIEIEAIPHPSQPVEVKSRSPDRKRVSNADAIESVAAALMRLFPGCLRPSPVGKYERGRRLAQADPSYH